MKKSQTPHMGFGNQTDLGSSLGSIFPCCTIYQQFEKYLQTLGSHM